MRYCGPGEALGFIEAASIDYEFEGGRAALFKVKASGCGLSAIALS